MFQTTTQAIRTRTAVTAKRTILFMDMGIAENL
jgi:hypothetical protein